MAQLPCTGNVTTSVTLVGDVNCPDNSRVQVNGNDIVIDGAGFTVRAAERSAAHSQAHTAQNQLGAFQNAAAAQAGKKIPAGTASAWIDAAKAISSALDSGACP